MSLARTPRVTILSAIFSAFVTATAAADTLSGTVFGGGSPLAQALVEALTDGTATVVAQAATGPDGTYSLSLASGTYDLRVTPPAGSGFGEETVQNVALSGVDRIYNVTLVTSGGGLQGTITGHGGVPVANALVNVTTVNFQPLGTVRTDANGFYSLPLGAGTVRIQVDSPEPWMPRAPSAPTNFYYVLQSVTITGSMTLDILLPVIKISGTVTDSNGAPVPGVMLQTDSTGGGPGTNWGSSNTRTLTDDNGLYEIVTFRRGEYFGSASLSVTPPAGINAGPLSEQLLQTTDITRDITLAPPAYLSGIVAGHAGVPVANALVNVTTVNFQPLGSVRTDANGFYSLPLGAGTVRIQVDSPLPWMPRAPSAPTNFYYVLQSVTITESMTLDILLPVIKISGAVTDSNGAPVQGVVLQTDSTGGGPGTNWGSSNTRTLTDANGLYEIVTFRRGEYFGSASLSVTPPAGTNAGPLSEQLLQTTDITRNITLAPPAFLSGIVAGHAGVPVANAMVNVTTVNFQPLGSVRTDANGFYSLPLGAGTVRIQVDSPVPWMPRAPSAPTNFYYVLQSVTITESMTLDIFLPVVKISGAVTDSNGAPVPGVMLQTDSTGGGPGANWGSSNTRTLTDANGLYEIVTFRKGEYFGSVGLTVTPPIASGFSTLSMGNVPLTADITQRIILQSPDLSPPQIVAGPVVVHLSDTSVSVSWTTTEAANSRVDYGVGSLETMAHDGEFTMNHTITLQNLSPLVPYNFTVSSADAAGNGPTTSAMGTFTTQASPGDITPPLVSEGPAVVFVDQTNAIVQWTTDEPASSRVDYGLTPALGAFLASAPGRFRQSHSLQMTGLRADTEYSGQVTSADPDGNSTASSVFTFRTLALPDTLAPVITAGPTAVTITDTKITVAWTTNEPSTSGVSYNDGTHYFVVSGESTLTREHSITLSGLAPMTLYHITVSSTDAVRNGPTLGAPLSATTAAVPDTAAPVINNLRVEAVAKDSAVVKWTTDEASTSAISYGATPGASDSTKAEVGAVTEHSLTLTGLLDGTEYHFTVRSVDASGNGAVSAVFTFTTAGAAVDTPPAPPVVTVPPGPTNAASLSISWNAVTDDVGVIGYEVVRNGEVMASVGLDTTLVDSTAPEGTVTYLVRATDTAGQTATSAPASVVVDRTPPVVTVPGDITVDALGATALVSFTASALDVVDGTLVVNCSAAPGAYPVGKTTVTCTANDAAGNSGTNSFTVTVRDVTPPVVTVPPDMVIEAGSPAGAVATFLASARDAVDGVVVVTCAPPSGSTFGVGSTVVACTATDSVDNIGRRDFTILVRDTTAPAITEMAPSQATLSPPNHKMVPLTLVMRATDVADESPVCSITNIISNEPTDGLGDGDTGPDWSFQGLSFVLRAERGGRGNGRVYTITAGCTDASGNTSSKSTTVVVPKNQSGR